MKCYYHHDKDAVGTCKSCQRGVCPECAVDMGKGLACRGHCEEDATGVIQLIDNNVRISPTSTRMLLANRGTGLTSGAFLIAIGLVFIWWGLRASESLIDFPLIMGVVVGVFGVISVARSMRIKPPGPDSRDSTPAP